MSAAGLPTIQVVSPIAVVQAIIEAGFAKSNGEARRHIQGGAIRVDDVAVADEKMMLSIAAAPVKLSMGKKKHVLLKS